MSEFIMLILGVFVGFMWSFTKVEPDQLDSINSSCKINKGIEKVIVDTFRTDVYCKDGAKFRIKD